MNTNVLTIQEIKQLVSEIMLNKTSKVSKISDDSTLNAILYGIAKPIQKGMKDVALVESHLFPEFAYGDNLDIIAARQGVSARFAASESSTFVKIVADPSKVIVYTAATNLFYSISGVSFRLENDITDSDPTGNPIGYQNYQDLVSFGYTYAKVRSVSSGLVTNVNPITINRVSPAPAGHLSVLNEYMAVGGRDEEDDDSLRKRIQETPNFLTAGTINKLTQVFQLINNNVLRVIYSGISNSGKRIISIFTQNGIDLSQDELDELLERGEEYFNITDQRLIGTSTYGIILQNISYYPIDIDFRAELLQSSNVDTVRKDIQVKISKYIDFKNWDYTKKVEWDTLIQIVKDTTGVKYVPDQFFTPSSDIKIERGYVPRLRGFIMRDINGNVITDVSGILNPVYYPNSQDKSLLSIFSSI